MAETAVSGMLQHIRRLAAVQTGRGLSDGALLERFVRANDEAAFTVLVERFGPTVLAVCRRVLGDADDAEDAFQATFLVLARKAASVRRTASLAGWLHRVAHAVAANARRERTRRRRREGEAPPAGSQAPADVSWRDVQAALDEELRRLPERYRAPLIFCYLDGRTRDEAARRLGLTPGTLHGRLERGRRILRERLTRRGFALSATLLALAVGQGAARAALSPTVTLATARAALRFARREAPAVSGHVLSLTREVLKAMLLTKLKLGATAVLCAALLLVAGVAGTHANPAPDARTLPGSAVRAAVKDAGAPGIPAAARELQGEWQAVAAESNGEKSDADDVTNLRMTFRGEEVLVHGADGAGRARRLRFKLHPGTSPRGIDLTSLDGPQKGQTSAWIYALEKGRLRLCGQSDKPGPRPTDFTTRDGDGKIALALERVGTTKPAAGPRPRDAAGELAAILREWQKAEEEFWQAFARAKTFDQRRQLEADKRAKAGPLAERCLKLAAAYPDRQAALGALFWAAGNAPDTDAGRQALALLRGGRIARAEPGALSWAIAAAGPRASSPQELARVVLERARQSLDHPRAARLLTWVCACYFRDAAPEVPRPFAAAADLIADRFADSPDIANFCECLAPAAGTPPSWASQYERHLRTILAKNRDRLVRVMAQFALASVVAAKGSGHQEEAAKLFEQFLKDFDASDPRTEAVERRYLRYARAALGDIRTRKEGMPAPEVEGEDLDGRPMKLSEFRGKVVLLSFWSTSCFPCMKLLPHERALVSRLRGLPFVLVGVNSDTDAAALARALKVEKVIWRSFRDRRAGRPAVSDEWQVLGYPTLYLIDHRGVIRRRWVGGPPPEELNRAVDELVAAVPRKE
jgi:RNA polymerase sigma-70 factor (ECF subfamily)